MVAGGEGADGGEGAEPRQPEPGGLALIDTVDMGASVFLMRSLFPVLGLALVFATGCVYKEPMVREARVPIDQDLVGLWERVEEDGKAPDESKRMLILRYSDTEYIVRQPVGDDGLYYRAYPIELGGVKCVQLEALGSGKGPIEGDNPDLFHVVSYRIEGGTLEVRTLNTSVVGKANRTTEALREAFLKNKDAVNLFENPGVFRKVGPNP